MPWLQNPTGKYEGDPLRVEEGITRSGAGAPLLSRSLELGGTVPVLDCSKSIFLGGACAFRL
jgi:hypothetical protein